MAELSCIIANSNPHIMFFTETWYNEMNIQSISKYKVFFKNRTCSSHGDVCISVDSVIESYENFENEFHNDSIEQIWCTIKCRKEKFLLGCIYRPPNSTNNKPIFEPFNKARSMLDSKIVDGIIICGDFNFPNID